MPDQLRNRHDGFFAELKQVSPDVFMVNEDGNTPKKARLCRRMGIRYVVLKRTPHGTLPPRSTTSLRQACRIPYRWIWPAAGSTSPLSPGMARGRF